MGAQNLSFKLNNIFHPKILYIPISPTLRQCITLCRFPQASDPPEYLTKVFYNSGQGGREIKAAAPRAGGGGARPARGEGWGG